MNRVLLSGPHSLLWNYGKEGAGLSVVVAGAGTLLTGWLGGWDNMVQTLVAFMAVDFVLGFLAACKSKTVDSQVMFWGGVNKVLVLVLVAVAVRVDVTMGLREPLCRTAACWFYLGREGLSMVENSAKLGFPWPPVLTQMLEQMKQRGAEGMEAPVEPGAARSALADRGAEGMEAPVEPGEEKDHG